MVMNSLGLGVLSGLLVFLFALLFSRIRHVHIGYGMSLAWRASDKTVWVSSVLLNSPAGRARVNWRTQVLSVNGQKMNFSKVEDFKDWVENSKPKLGLNREEDWSFSDGLHVVLRPAIIVEKIPVYWNPNSSQMEGVQLHPDIKKTTWFCKKTGVFYHRNKISRFALVRTFSDGEV
jgi:hypothetical protein